MRKSGLAGVLAAMALAITLARPVDAAPTPKGELILSAPKPAPEGPFQDLSGTSKKLADFKGRIAIVNLWATWCAPCIKEMPSLADLARALPKDKFIVAPISMDRGGPEVVKAFWAKLKVQGLESYIDPTTKLGFALKAEGMPTTVILNAKGEEIGRVTGELDWAAPWIVEQIQALAK